MLDVPKEPSHTPSRTYYLWCIDQDLVLEKVRVDLYEKALKLLQRWEDEFSAVRDITARLEVDKNYEPSTEELKRMARVKSSCDTLDGKLLHIDDRVGSIKTGKDADLVLWSDNPLSIYAKAEKTLIQGKVFFDIEKDKKLREEIQQQRSTLITQMLQAKNKGLKTQPVTKKEEQHIHCNLLEEIH